MCISKDWMQINNLQNFLNVILNNASVVSKKFSNNYKRTSYKIVTNTNSNCFRTAIIMD